MYRTELKTNVSIDAYFNSDSATDSVTDSAKHQLDKVMAYCTPVQNCSDCHLPVYRTTGFMGCSECRRVVCFTCAITVSYYFDMFHHLFSNLKVDVMVLQRTDIPLIRRVYECMLSRLDVRSFYFCISCRDHTMKLHNSKLSLAEFESLCRLATNPQLIYGQFNSPGSILTANGEVLNSLVCEMTQHINDANIVVSEENMDVQNHIIFKHVLRTCVQNTLKKSVVDDANGDCVSPIGRLMRTPCLIRHGIHTMKTNDVSREEWISKTVSHRLTIRCLKCWRVGLRYRSIDELIRMYMARECLCFRQEIDFLI